MEHHSQGGANAYLILACNINRYMKRPEITQEKDLVTLSGTHSETQPARSQESRVSGGIISISDTRWNRC